MARVRAPVPLPADLSFLLHYLARPRDRTASGPLPGVVTVVMRANWHLSDGAGLPASISVEVAPGPDANINTPESLRYHSGVTPP
ncbi:unnamed protein product [Arctogadus glacialis]